MSGVCIVQKLWAIKCRNFCFLWLRPGVFEADRMRQPCRLPTQSCGRSKMFSYHHGDLLLQHAACKTLAFIPQVSHPPLVLVRALAPAKAKPAARLSAKKSTGTEVPTAKAHHPAVTICRNLVEPICSKLDGTRSWNDDDDSGQALPVWPSAPLKEALAWQPVLPNQSRIG